MGFLASWLEDRTSQVVLGGACSAAGPLIKNVFQGTMLGLPLWNALLGDTRRALNRKHCVETVPADNLTAGKLFGWKGRGPPHDTALEELQGAQHELHF